MFALRHRRGRLLLLLLLLLAVSSSSALPTSDPVDPVPSKGGSSVDSLTAGKASPQRQLGISLRAMPFGASITSGVGSTHHNGYRQLLRMRLVQDGFDVHMLGSNPSGDMAENGNEGWPGLRIDEVDERHSHEVGKYRPNLLLVNVGTNDAVQDYQTSGTYGRMLMLLNHLWLQAPDVTIILSTLTVCKNPAINARIEDMNNQIKLLVVTLAVQKKRIVLAEMQSDHGPNVHDLQKDGMHPADIGYEKMAAIWHEAIHKALNENMIQDTQPPR